MNGSNYAGYRGAYHCGIAIIITVDLEWAIKLNRLTLRVLGLWPNAKRIPREKLKQNLRVLVISLMITFSLLVPCIRSLIMFHEDVMIIFEHMEFIMPFVICVIKLVIFWWKEEAVIPVMNMITEDWLIMRNKQERDMMITWAQRTRIVTSSAYFVMGIAYFCLIFLPFFGISTGYMTNVTDVNKLLPFPGYYEYDVTKRPQYELTYISHAIAVFFAVMSYTGVDNFLGLVVFHICGQMDILRSRLMYLGKFIKFQNGLKICVTHHIRLLRAIAVIEDTYNIMLLALFLYFGLCFVFYGFLIISLVEEKDYISIGRIIFCICAVVNIFIHVGLYCAVGEILIAQCNRVYHAVYSQKWYSLNPRNAKDLIPLMIKSAEVSYITAGKVFPMTMTTFSHVMKTSAGYVSVLLTTRN